MLPTTIKDTDFSFTLSNQTCQRFTLSEIQSATNNFDETLVIGCGGFGKVYKSPTKIGSVNEVAIKLLHSTSNQGANEFEAEVNVLSKLRHGNLVSLIGYCNEGNDMALVYEFMPNGTLEENLHKPNSSFSWLQLLKICIGAARGLEYLHTGTSTQHGVIHRDVKSSNILLDANFDAKISDFGLAKVGLIDRTHVSTAVKGTFGYMDSSYFCTGKLSIKSDVYAFGVVLFEVLSGKKVLDSSTYGEQWGLAGWAQHQLKEGKLNKVIDPRLIGQISRKCLKEFATIADHCLQMQPNKRPSMAEVVVKLESILSQERKSATCIVHEEGLVYKLRSLFTSKVIDVGTGSKTNQIFRAFTYDELIIATNDFNHMEYSSTLAKHIWKGWVDERTYAPTKFGVGLPMYVRRIEFLTSQLDMKLEEFIHPNLVKLFGYCFKNNVLFCVYEDFSGITLDKHLYGGRTRTSLSWVARLKIAIGATEGLFYLHKRNKPAYSLFNTKYILVDTDFNARLLDFVFDSFTFQFTGYYASPELFHYRVNAFYSASPWELPEHGFGVKSEIYSLGVVLLEILTGMVAHDERRPLGKKKLMDWAIPLLAKKDKLGLLMDPQLQQNDSPPKGAFKLALLVLNCLQSKPEKRPSMEKILKVLHRCYQEEIKTVATLLENDPFKTDDEQ